MRFLISKFYPSLFTTTMSLLSILPVHKMEDGLLASSCIKPCVCSSILFSGYSKPLLTVNCTYAKLANFPHNTPNATEALLWSENNLKNLSNLPVLSQLRLLDLSYNRIRYLDNHWVFEHMELLRELSLRGNILKTLQHGSFSGLTSLDTLDLSENKIQTIELHAFGGLNHLSILYLSYNQLYELKRSWLLSMTSLKELYVQGNHISAIQDNTFDKLSSLTHLDISDNVIRKVLVNGFSGLNTVKVLNMSANNLTSIPTQELQNLPNVENLFLDSIKIHRLQAGAFANLSVVLLSLSFLPNLRVVEKNVFYNLTRLRILHAHDNPSLIFLHPHAFQTTPLLHRLFLHNNSLVAVSSEIKNSLPNLKELYLYHNPLHCDCNIFWLKTDLDFYQAENLSESSYIKETDKLMCNSPILNSNLLLSELSSQFLSPVCPPTTLPFFFDKHNVSIGDDLYLECQAIGVPEPTMSWLLPDGHEINSSSGATNITAGDNTAIRIKNVKIMDQGTYACKASNSVGFDISSTAVSVQNKDLRLIVTDVANDHITVGWVGSIPRWQMSNYQIFYGITGMKTVYDKIYLHGSMRKCILTGLLPMTTYQICIMYREIYSVQCRNFTTDDKVRTPEPAITRVNVIHIVMGTGAVLGVIVALCVIKIICKRLKKRNDYADPFNENGEMDKIPLKPIDQTPGTPLCSSRTMLLPHSQI